MTKEEDITTGIDARARAVLQQSLTRVDARTRSRLNEARQAALEVSARARPAAWRGWTLVPFGGAVTAAVLAAALTLFGPGSRDGASKGESAQPSIEVLDLLADGESLSLMENYDRGFYEWAAAQGGAAPHGGTLHGDSNEGTRPAS